MKNNLRYQTKVFLLSIYQNLERNNFSASQQLSKKAESHQNIIERNAMKSNTKNRCQDKALLRLDISNNPDLDSANKDVISNDVNDYVIRDKNLEKETSFDGGKTSSDAKLSTELSMLPDVVDCKGT